ncbi:hypothetical protein G9A89_006213 [Geosiphon pyriformis]|nr:hypothetical protein G9A89_006213 [Geosiphon pyriformis]
MTRGRSLENDLKFILNNPRYSDLKIKCSDSTTTSQHLHASRILLAARSEVFDRLLFNGMLETTQNEINFPDMSTSSMEIVLEFLYTGKIEENNLSSCNIVNAFDAANYFLLEDLEKILFTFLEKLLDQGNFDRLDAIKLLDSTLQKNHATQQNRLQLLLCEFLGKEPLGNIEDNNFSAEMLEVFLLNTLKSEEYFSMEEYTLFSWVMNFSANQVSSDARRLYSDLLPDLSSLNKDVVSHKAGVDHLKDDQNKKLHLSVIEKAKPFLSHINLNFIPMKILAAIIQPLEIFPPNRVIEAFSHHVLSKEAEKVRRGTPFIKLAWDSFNCGRSLTFNSDNTVVEARKDPKLQQCVRTSDPISGPIVYKWMVVIHKSLPQTRAWVGVCAEEMINYSMFLGVQKNSWGISSQGEYWNHDQAPIRESFEFGTGDEIKIEVDLIQKSLKFILNGTEVYKPSRCDFLPEKVYPAVSLGSSGRFRIAKVGNSQSKKG